MKQAARDLTEDNRPSDTPPNSNGPRDDRQTASPTRLTDHRALLRRLEALVLYQSLLQVPAIAAWVQLWRQGTATQIDDHGLLRAYGHWFSAMADSGQGWAELIINQILGADNPFSRTAAQGQLEDPGSPTRELPQALQRAARQDLATLQLLLPWTGQALSQWVDDRVRLASPLPAWVAEAPAPALVTDTSTATPWAEKTQVWLKVSPDWGNDLALLIDYYRHQGVGLLGRYRAFRWQGGALVGIATPDPIRLDQLVGYETPKAALVANTERLLAGQPALNVLLYGSRGAGKSSLVKALVNEYGDRGLRLVEVAKADLQQLPQIIEPLQSWPQKFILFVDDLSFEADDEAFKGLKVALEGGVTARPNNIVVYATSNRRHLIREFFDDRPRPSDAAEIHSWDTVQEKLSFRDRFGLTLTFEPAEQERYLAIVRHLADQAQLNLEGADLDFRARQWATRHNGPSGRTARQFVDWLQGGADDPTIVLGASDAPPLNA